MKCEICGKEILRDSQCINYKYYHNDCIENLEKQNKQLKEKLDKYENPEDMTLIFMYCEEKAKDKIKELLQENQKYKEAIDKAIEILKLCNSQCAKETIDILKEVE